MMIVRISRMVGIYSPDDAADDADAADAAADDSTGARGVAAATRGVMTTGVSSSSE